MTIVGVELEEIALDELPDDDDAISGSLALRSSVARAFVTTATAPKAATQATAAPTAGRRRLPRLCGWGRRLVSSPSDALS